MYMYFKNTSSYIPPVSKYSIPHVYFPKLAVSGGNTYCKMDGPFGPYISNVWSRGTVSFVKYSLGEPFLGGTKYVVTQPLSS